MWGGIAASPDSVFPTNDTDELTSYQVQQDGSLKRLGAFDRSVLPQAIFESAAAGPWLFTCDASGNCLEFRVDANGNLARGADISSAHIFQIAGIDPTGKWLIATGPQRKGVSDPSRRYSVARARYSSSASASQYESWFNEFLHHAL